MVFALSKPKKTKRVDIMKRLEIASDSKFGELTVVQEVESMSKKRRFQCKCSCGAEPIVRLDHLRSGHTQSCGNCGIEHDGERMSLRDWAAMAGMPESTLRARLETMTMKEALLR
jgi:hypothetical protein